MMQATDHRSVLFVDDEPDILVSIKDSLEPYRESWSMHFAGGGAEALKILEQQRINLLVTDLQMPGMDGANLLAESRRRHPETARVVMSGFYDKETALRLVCATHQYLPKPCAPDRLSNAINRIFRLRELLSSETLQRLVARIKSLPSPPLVYTQLMAELERDEPELEKIGQVISHDPSMSAKILQLVNSAYFGLPREISHPSEATMFLGVDLIRGLVLMAHVFTQFDNSKMAAFSIDRLMEHCWLTGVVARGIAGAEELDARSCDHAFLAGLLHDIGKLILMANLPQLYQDVLKKVETGRRPLAEVEADVLGCNHAELGAYLMGLWGLPDPVVEAVAFHYQPKACEAGNCSMPAIIYAASELEKIKDSLAGIKALPSAAQQELEGAGVSAKLERWCELSRRLMKRE
jgi:HD-like signal output (HDOD) protein/CheY-like chemotaxis protein